MPDRHAAVVGAGIAGLAAAGALAARGWAVEVFEASERAGGRIGSRLDEGCLLESGPDGFFAGTEPLEKLISRLGLERDVIEPLPGWAGLVRSGRIVPMPQHLWNGIPYLRREIVASRVLWPLDRLRLLAEPLVPRRAAAPGATPESLDEMLARRAGRGAARRLLGPLLAGVHAGRASELEAASVAPALAAAERESGSWLRTARRAASRRGRDGDGAASRRPLRSLAGGMDALIDALAADLVSRGVAIHLSSTVAALRLEPDGWCLRAAEREVRAAAVVLAVPPPQVAALIGSVAPDSARAAAEVSLADALLVHLRSAEPLPPEYRGLHGAIAPPDEPGPLSALTLATQKWPGRAPAGIVTIRASIRDGVSPADAPDAVMRLLRLGRPPEIVSLERQAAAFPVMRLGHAALVARFRSGLEAAGVSDSLAVVGGAWDGVGLGALVTAAERAAAALAPGPASAALPRPGAEPLSERGSVR